MGAAPQSLTMPPLALIGAYLDGESYPHARTTIAELRRRGHVALDLVRPLAPRPLWQARTKMGRTASSVFAGLSLFVAAFASVAHWTITRRRGLIGYVAYPALPTLALLGLLPRRWRPERVVADAFVSWYDAAVNDRALISRTSLAARTLWHLERGAYRLADRVVVDTEANAAWYTHLFDLPPDRFVSMPLAMPEADSVAPNAVEPRVVPKAQGILRVLFCGTFVPLQGTSVLARAIAQLNSEAGLEFVVIGDGQDGAAFADELGPAASKVRWIRRIVSSSALRAWVDSADVCIGVLGANPKSKRVWPLKNYLYGQAGRAIVTSEHYSLPAGVSLGATDALTIPPADPQSLIDALRSLARDPECVAALAAGSARFFRRHLSLECSITALERTMGELGADLV
jgi:glycosyltransferase involved in cell wall biosynthesis